MLLQTCKCLLSLPLVCLILLFFLTVKFAFVVVFCPTLFYVAGCQDLDKTQDDLLKHQASISELKRNFMESTPEPRPNEWEKRRITPLSLQTQGVCLCTHLSACISIQPCRQCKRPLSFTLILLANVIFVYIRYTFNFLLLIIGPGFK